MNQEQWTAVDRYICDQLISHDPALDAALESSAAAGLPGINVTPSQGKLLHLLTLLAGARNILEIGTLGAYSTLWFARALPPGGRIITLEANPRNAEVAKGNIARAGLSDVVELRLGPALETLPQLEAEGRGPFDLVFIDADKPSMAEYLAWALRLSRPGSLIIADNVVRKGALVDAGNQDPDIGGARRLFKALAAEHRVTATALQTVGSKGYDGFAIALVTGSGTS